MAPGNPAAFKRELKRHLDALAKETGKDMHALRREAAFEACLKRLSTSALHFVLKGAYALEVRSPLRSRTTQDLDVLFLDERLRSLSDDELADELSKMLASALRSPSDDHFSFEIIEIKKEIGGRGTEGVRFFIAARLLGQNFERFLMDVVVGDAFLDSAETAHAGRYLSGMGLRKESVPLLRRSQHFAEKLHAYTLPREGLNTRVKDLVDFIVLNELGEIDPGELGRAIALVFSHRGTHLPPEALPPPPVEWALPYARLASGAGIEQTMAEAHALAASIYAEARSLAAKAA